MLNRVLLGVIAGQRIVAPTPSGPPGVPADAISLLREPLWGFTAGSTNHTVEDLGTDPTTGGFLYTYTGPSNGSFSLDFAYKGTTGFPSIPTDTLYAYISFLSPDNGTAASNRVFFLNGSTYIAASNSPNNDGSGTFTWQYSSSTARPKVAVSVAGTQTQPIQFVVRYVGYTPL